MRPPTRNSLFGRAKAMARPLLAICLVVGWPIISQVAQAESLPASLRPTLADTHQQQTPQQKWLMGQWRDRMDPQLAGFIPAPAERRELLTNIYQEARLAGLPPALVLALIHVESTFNADAVSSAGAVGLMQIMPFWVEELGLPMDDLSHPTRNLRYGCTILAHYLAVEQGDFTRALARYNGSLGETWYPERVLHAWRDHWQ